MIWQVRTDALVHQLPGFKSQLYHVRVVGSSTSYLNFICKVGIMTLLNYMVVVKLKDVEYIERAWNNCTCEELNKYWYYSCIYLIQESSSQRVLLFLILKLKWLKGLSMVPSPGSVCFPAYYSSSCSRNCHLLLASCGCSLFYQETQFLVLDFPEVSPSQGQLEEFLPRLRG